MKKLVMALLLASAGLISGCGNMDVMDWHWTFHRAYVRTADGWKSVKVKNWHDYDGSDMIAVETDTNVYVTHSCNVVLVKDKNGKED